MTSYAPLMSYVCELRMTKKKTKTWPLFNYIIMSRIYLAWTRTICHRMEESKSSIKEQCPYVIFATTQVQVHNFDGRSFLCDVHLCSWHNYGNVCFNA